VRPDRLVFLIPGDKAEFKYEGFRQKANRWMPRQLPEYKVKWSPIRAGGGIVYFEPNWTPHLQEFKTTWLRQTFWDLFAAPLKIGLKPVYEQLGVNWTKPPVQFMQVLYMFVLFLLAALVVYYIYGVVKNILLT